MIADNKGKFAVGHKKAVLSEFERRNDVLCFPPANINSNESSVIVITFFSLYFDIIISCILFILVV